MSTEEVEIAEGLHAVARAIIRLGNADASTPMGGLEALGKIILDAADSLGSQLSYLEGLDNAILVLASEQQGIAEAIKEFTLVYAQANGIDLSKPKKRHELPP